MQRREIHQESEWVEAAPRTDASPFGREAQRQLVGLMFARLLLTLVSLGIVLVLDQSGLVEPLGERARHGIYWTLALGFLATAFSGWWLRRSERPARFASVQMAIDLCVVSLLVHLSGGHESVFTFLYVAVTAVGAVLLERKSAVLAACGSAGAYGGVLVIEQLGFGSAFDGAHETAHAAVVFGTWAIHVGALFLVAGLGGLVTRELRQAGAQLGRTSDVNRQLRDLNAHIVQSLNSGLLTTDLEGRVGSFNPQAERIVGRKAEAVLGRAVDEILPGAEGMLRPSVEGVGAPLRRHRLSYTGPGGEEKFLGLAGAALRDERGLPVGGLLIFQDVTSVVEMETSLTQRERLAAVGEMAARIAHEVRNPLAAISGSVQLLRSSHGMTQEQDFQQLMGIVVREADRLSSLIGDFLGYARPPSPVSERVDLHEVAREVLTVLRGSVDSGVCFALRGDPDAMLYGDPGELRQVLWNLCLNAVEAMPKGGTVVVSVEWAAQGAGGTRRREGQESHEICGDYGSTCADLMVSVEDEGEGVDPQWLDRLFEPFFTTKSGGTGLGLATVHRIVEAHGGQVEVETRPGGGTRFCFRLESRLHPA
jgi:two-component system sensor histidine kinase PilS (NtrC family)